MDSTAIVASNKPLSTTVNVQIEWPSNTMDRKVPEQLESLGKMLVRGTYKQIINAAWQSPNLKEELQLLVLKETESAWQCALKRS